MALLYWQNGIIITPIILEIYILAYYQRRLHEITNNFIKVVTSSFPVYFCLPFNRRR